MSQDETHSNNANKINKVHTKVYPGRKIRLSDPVGFTMENCRILLYPIRSCEACSPWDTSERKTVENLLLEYKLCRNFRRLY